jgi:hypothetical protein
MFAPAYVGRRRGAEPDPELSARGNKAFEVFHFRPMYAGVNMGHPSGSWQHLKNLAPDQRGFKTIMAFEAPNTGMCLVCNRG